MNLEIVTWEDAWTEFGDLEIKKLDSEPLVTKSIGWIIKENKKGILLTSELWPSSPDNCYNATFLPHKMIVHREVLTTQTEVE